MIARMTLWVGETWSPIPSLPGYEASSQGQVRSVARVIMRCNGRPKTVPGRLLTLRTEPETGYRVLTIHSRTRRVHALVLEAFRGPRPAGLEACHGNGDGSDNRLANLRWDTRSSNAYDRVRHGTHPDAAKTHCPQGHPLTEPNLIPSNKSRKNRACRACHRARAYVSRHPEVDLQDTADQYYARLVA